MVHIDEAVPGNILASLCGCAKVSSGICFRVRQHSPSYCRWGLLAKHHPPSATGLLMERTCHGPTRALSVMWNLLSAAALYLPRCRPGRRNPNAEAATLRVVQLLWSALCAARLGYTYCLAICQETMSSCLPVCLGCLSRHIHLSRHAYVPQPPGLKILVICVEAPTVFSCAAAAVRSLLRPAIMGYETRTECLNTMACFISR